MPAGSKMWNSALSSACRSRINHFYGPTNFISPQQEAKGGCGAGTSECAHMQTSHEPRAHGSSDGVRFVEYIQENIREVC